MTRIAGHLRLLAVLGCIGIVEPASAQLSFERPPIEYSKTAARDQIALLVDEINADRTSLHRDDSTGYLNSLLTALDIPVSSQTLVFSKTSLQRHLISSSNPRAIFFNDNTYVGWIPNGELIEMASTDPQLGSVFYVLRQSGIRNVGSILRETEQCLFCHGSSETGRVPGLLMQSIYTDRDGNRVFPQRSIPPRSNGPLAGRWAGWFVTGTHGEQRHLGNLAVDSRTEVTMGTTHAGANIVDLSPWFDVTKYPTPHSDIVALLVLQHQVSLHNLLTDANHRARMQLHLSLGGSETDESSPRTLSEEDLAILDQVAEQVVDGLLMVGESRWSEPIEGTSSFTKEFQQRGPNDSSGRSLRQFDLRTTLFRYPCSYLIYSDSFDSLPEPVLTSVYKRLSNVLSSNDIREKYRHLSPQNRKAIREILRDTKPKIASSIE